MGGRNGSGEDRKEILDFRAGPVTTYRGKMKKQCVKRKILSENSDYRHYFFGQKRGEKVEISGK